MTGLRSLVLVSVATASIAFGMLPANADSAAGAGGFAGSGTISQGLTTRGSFQTYTFNGTGAITVADTTTLTPLAGTMNCSMTGTDTIGTLVQSAGQLNGGCTVTNVTPAGGENCTFSGGGYTRVLVVETANAGITCTGPVNFSGSLIATCVFVPLSAPPVTVFGLFCAYSLIPL